MANSQQPITSSHHLGDGLVLRRAKAADREAVAEFHANTLLDVDEEPPLQRLYYFVLDLMSGAHPHGRPEDFTVVEDAVTGRIVSSMGLISQTWTYEGVPFRVGQPDIVSTDPAYRRRGLVRAQMAVIHRLSAERGELVQGITGIPWYYRQFDYEMALSLEASRSARPGDVPRLREGEAESFRFRPATAADIPFIIAMYARTTARSAVAAVRGEAFWRYDVERRDPRSGASSEYRIIEPASGGEPAGLLAYARKLWAGDVGVRLYEVKAGVPWLAPTPSVMRCLDAVGEAYAERDGVVYEGIRFELGESHPLYETVPERLPRIGRPYAWFIRVPDLPAFLGQIAPALEARLASSPQAGYSGEMTISFFRSGLRLRFAEGRIAVAPWQSERIEAGDAQFPDLSFLPLLLGFRSLDDQLYAFPDCAVPSESARALLPILFPKRPSHVLSGG